MKHNPVFAVAVTGINSRLLPIVRGHFENSYKISYLTILLRRSHILISQISGISIRLIDFFVNEKKRQMFTFTDRKIRRPNDERCKTSARFPATGRVDESRRLSGVDCAHAT